MLMLRSSTASVPVLVKVALATAAVAVLAFTPLLTARAADGGHEGAGGWRQFSGEPITLYLQDADIRDVLAKFATLVDKDILIEPGVQASVNVDVVETPWDEVLYTILEDHGLQVVEEGDRFIVRKITSPHLPVPRSEVVEDLGGEEVFRFVKHGEISEPRKISCPHPVYPEEARAAGVTGIVVLETIIDATGRVRSIEVARGESHGLTDAAVEAVRGWIFEPAMLDGEPVAVRYVLAVRFALDDKKID